MSKTLTASDRKSLIRLASTLPVGSPERRAILAGLSKAPVAKSASTLGKKVSLQGLIEGYQDNNPNRLLMMFGPSVDLNTWIKAMTEGEAAEYNEFDVKRAAKWLKARGITKVNPAREYSVAVYFQLPPDADPKRFLRRGGARADEISTHLGGPGGKALNWSFGGSNIADTTRALEPR